MVWRFMAMESWSWGYTIGSISKALYLSSDRIEKNHPAKSTWLGLTVQLVKESVIFMLAYVNAPWYDCQTIHNHDRAKAPNLGKT